MLSGDGRSEPRIAVLIAGGQLAHMLVNRLETRFGALLVLKEEPESKLAIVRRRARLIGWRQALGQMAFGLLQRLVQRHSVRRLAAIWHAHGLNPEPPSSGWQEIGSVNAAACRQALRQFRPDVVVVYGTRIIRWRTLGALAAPFINYHAGINPKYRGQNGAYWRAAGPMMPLPGSPSISSMKASTPAPFSTRRMSRSRATTTSPLTSTGRWPWPCRC